MEVPVGTVPLNAAEMDAASPAQTVAPVPVIVKFVTVWFAKPEAPLVAPLGGNSVKCAELVVPLAPGVTVCEAEPPEVAI